MDLVEETVNIGFLRFLGDYICVRIYGVGNCSVFFKNMHELHRLVWYNIFGIESNKDFIVGKVRFMSGKMKSSI